MHYLVTGGAGFIGSHLADALVRRGETVTLFDDLSTGSKDNIRHLIEHPRVTWVQGSVLDAASVMELVEEADAVVHLAASVGVRLIMEKPLESFLNNIRGTENVLGASARFGRRVLVTSTSEIYGKNGDGALREDSDRILGSPFIARWSYSTSKAVDEILAYRYHAERGLPAIVARLFNCVGPRQTGHYGMVVPRFVRQALRGEDVTVYGEGTQRRCFCHVQDAVRALILLLGCDEAAGGVFNIGGTEEVTIGELAEHVVRLTGSSSRIVRIPYEEAFPEGFEDMERRLPDNGRIRALTKWEPTKHLDEILLDVIEYERMPMATRVSS